MLLPLCIVYFVLTSVCHSISAQGVQACVSYQNLSNFQPLLNVNWNFNNGTTTEVMITFEQDNGNTFNRTFNGTNVNDVPFMLGTNREPIDVTVCPVDDSSLCRSVITAVNPIYNVTWRRLSNTSLELTCEVACRTPSITGCTVILDSDDGSPTLSGGSSDVTGGNETINSRFVTVVVDNLIPTAGYTYTATATAIEDGATVITENVVNIIPAAIQLPVTTTEQVSTPTMSATLTSSVTTSVNLDTTSGISSSTSSSIMPTSSNIASTPSNTVTVGAANDDDDDDDDGYLPVIIAASCACVLLLVVAIILLIIIIRVKRRSSGSNLSSPSASKVNNYDDLGDVKYFPMLDSQSNMQKSQSPPDDTQNQEPQIKKAPEYEFPVFTTVEQNPQVTASYDLLSASDAKYDSPDAILNQRSQPNDPPVDPLYDPVTLESAPPPADGTKSPAVEYDKLMHSPTPQPISHFPPSIYDTLSEKNLRDHYEFPDKIDGNGMVESNTQLRRVVTGNGDEYTIPQSS